MSPADRLDDLRGKALARYLAAEDPGEVYRAREAMRAVRACDDAEDGIAKAERQDAEARRREAAAEEALSRAQRASCRLCGHCDDIGHIRDLERVLDDAEAHGAATSQKLADAEASLATAITRAEAALEALAAHDDATLHRALETT